MFSKNEANQSKRRTRAWSLAARLTLLYAASAFGLLALASGFLFWVLTSSLQREDTEFLSDKINSLRASLTQPAPRAAMLPEATVSPGEQAEQGGRSFQLFYIRLTDAHGQTRRETPGMNTLMPTRVFPSPGPMQPEGSGQVAHWSKAGRDYWLQSAWVKTDAPDGPAQIAQIALDESDDEALLAEYRRMMGLMLLVGLLVSALLGYAVTRHSMRPVARMTELMQSIRVPHLDRRVAPGDWPGELLTLATTFDAMLDHLEDAFARLSRFSADLAHELRTPLGNLRGEAEVALSRARSAGEYRETLESSLEEYARLSRMIDSLLFLARAEGQDTLLVCAPLNGQVETEAVAAFHKAVAEDKGVALTCEGAATIYADTTLLRRAVSNLLANALQYTPRGGEIILSVQQTTDGASTIRVRDTGAGITPEHLPHVLDRFYRADAARSHYPQGTGLGLSIVHSIMALHGGTVNLHSEPGQGTTATLVFPAPAADTSGPST